MRSGWCAAARYGGGEHGGDEGDGGPQFEDLLDEPQVFDDVFDVEQGFGGAVGAGDGGSAPGGRAGRGRAVAGWAAGSSSQKVLPAAGGAGDAGGAAHGLDEAAGQGQAQAGALDAGLGGVEALERGERLARGGGRCPGRLGVTLIRSRCTGAGGDRGGDRAAGVVVLDRVRQQVQQHLPQPLPVGQHVPARVRRGWGGAPAWPGRPGQRPDQFQRPGDHLGRGHRLDRQRQLPLLDPGDVEHIVQQVQTGASAACRIISTHSRCSAVMSPKLSSSPKPSTAFSGVRSS